MVPFCVFMLLALYAGSIYWVRRWGWPLLQRQWRVSRLKRYLVKPERCDGRAESWLRAQRPRVTYFLARLITVGLTACCLPTASQAWSMASPIGKVLLVLVGMGVAKIWIDGERAVEDIRRSPWVSAQRLIDG